MWGSTRVVFARFRGEVALPAGRGDSILERKRMLWSDRVRNKWIAHLAAALAGAGAVKTLRGLGVSDAGGLLPAGRRPRVVLLVESAEHGRQLAELLPHWAL